MGHDIRRLEQPYRNVYQLQDVIQFMFKTVEIKHRINIKNTPSSTHRDHE